jgi:alkanesulfonate monooxygenase SsuD/methylene tetrahydromethanopterin reductase-like flavin-dependent oxidoreductase (luciferase family)
MIKVGKLGDRAGIDSLWVTESTLVPGRDSISTIGALAASTSRIKLATGIMNIFTRTSTLIASTVATLDELSKGRMILGLGTGHKDPLTHWHSVKFEHPLTRMKESVEVIRAILSAETVDYKGRTVSIRGFKLAMNSTRRLVPIYIAAVGEEMAKLAGKVGDGVLVTMKPVKQLKTFLDYALQASQTVHSKGFQTAAYVLSFISEDQEANLGAARRVIATYCAAPFYNRVFVNAGYEREAHEISTYWNTGHKDSAAQAVTERMIGDFASIGIEEAIRTTEKYRKQGVNLPILSVVYGPDFDKSASKLFRELQT